MWEDVWPKNYSFSLISQSDRSPTLGGVGAESSGEVWGFVVIEILLAALVSFPYGAQKHNYAPIELALILQIGFFVLFSFS